MRIMPGETFNCWAIWAKATRPSLRSASIMDRSILSRVWGYSGSFTISAPISSRNTGRGNVPLEYILDYQRHDRRGRFAHPRRFADHLGHKAVHFPRITRQHLHADICLADGTRYI